MIKNEKKLATCVQCSLVTYSHRRATQHCRQSWTSDVCAIWFEQVTMTLISQHTKFQLTFVVSVFYDFFLSMFLLSLNKETRFLWVRTMDELLLYLLAKYGEWDEANNVSYCAELLRWTATMSSGTYNILRAIRSMCELCIPVSQDYLFWAAEPMTQHRQPSRVWTWGTNGFC